MKGNVWAPIHLKPKHARLKGTVGEKIEQVVHVKGQKKEPLIVKLASVSIPDKVEVELTEIENGRSWELKVRNKVAEQTTYNGQVKLTTNYPETPEMVIRFSGNIRPSVEVRPKTVSFGRLSKEKLQQLESKGLPMRRPVTVILNKGSDLKISKVELEKSLFKVAVNKAVRPGRIVTFQIEALVDKLQKGLNTDRLKIHTNQKDSEILEVPIRLEVL
jgi:hypothetical protein